MTPSERRKRGSVMGRPPLPAEEKLLPYSIRLTLSERDKLRSLGGRAAVRRWLASKKLPKE